MSGTPIVIALPGFTRGPGNLQRLADACNATGFDCVRPALAPRWMPVLYMEPTGLRRIAERLAARAGARSIVVAGHSAGAAAGCFITVELQALGADVRGIVLIDGVDSPTHLVTRCLPSVDGRVAAVLAPPSPCNRQGALAQYLSGCPEVRIEVIDGAGHGDIEGAGIGIYRRACGDTSDADTADRFLAATINAIGWVHAGASVAVSD